MIKNLLLQSGLNETQSVILIHLLQHGESIASLISKQLKIKRTTVYATLDSLLKIGLVIKQTRSSVSYFKAINKELIPNIIEENALQIYDSKKRISERIGCELKSFDIQSINISGYSIDVMETDSGVNISLENVLRAGDFVGIFNPQINLKEKRQKEIVYEYLQATALTEPHIREIAVDGPMTRWYASHVRNKNHELRVISQDQKILSDMIFSHGSVYVLHYDKSHEMGIKVTQTDFYNSMMTIFEILWEKATILKN